MKHETWGASGAERRVPDEARVIAQLLQRSDGRENTSCFAAGQDAADLFAVQKVLVYACLW
jgi:hypothetical protein